MRILRHYDRVDASARGAVVALGNFDGVHRGHAAVIGAAGRLARDANAPLAVLTFEPHPRHFFQPGSVPFRLTPFRVKARRMAALGVDVMVNLHFGPAIAGLLAQEFVADVLLRGLALSHLVVGPGFVFGKGRRGNAQVLRHMAAMEGFGFTEVAAERHAGEICSSTDIRVLVRRGLVDEAAERLGWTWEFEGRVVPGEARGRAIGFPTANIALDGRLHPGPGIYAVRAGITEAGVVTWHDGAAYIGSRPTFAGETVLLETHLFNFDGDLYGRRLRVAFVQRVRKDQGFESVEALTAQMTADCQRARHILADARDIAEPISNPPAA